MSTADELEADDARLLEGIVLASEGTGPLLQRDYWAVLRNCRLAPPDLVDTIARDFCEFAPSDLVRFERALRHPEPLELGEEMEVDIRMAGSCRVRVVHRDRNSLTLATLRGHPEAGRITFGSYRSADGEVIFHIRSRARSSSGTKYAGYVAAGEPMQTNTWTDFIDRVAHTVGDGVTGVIHAETTPIEDEGDVPERVCTPTFLAVGD